MKNESINFIFKILCEKYGFHREKNSGVRKYTNLDLYVNLQKSGNGQYFFINSIILYPDLLDHQIDFNINEIFGIKSPFFPHVSFRIECLMKDDGIDQNLYDNLYSEKKWNDLNEALDKSFHRLIQYGESGEFDRGNIRNSMKNGVISAMIRKDV